MTNSIKAIIIACAMASPANAEFDFKRDHAACWGFYDIVSKIHDNQRERESALRNAKFISQYYGKESFGKDAEAWTRYWIPVVISEDDTQFRFVKSECIPKVIAVRTAFDAGERHGD